MHTVDEKVGYFVGGYFIRTLRGRAESHEILTLKVFGLQ